jgi:phage-related protein
MEAMAMLAIVVANAPAIPIRDVNMPAVMVLALPRLTPIVYPVLADIATVLAPVVACVAAMVTPVFSDVTAVFVPILTNIAAVLAPVFDPFTSPGSALLMSHPAFVMDILTRAFLAAA